MTDRKDSSKNQTSSYLELSPLYGNNQEEQNCMRTFQDGTIKADCFSNTRVLGFPKGVGRALPFLNLRVVKLTRYRGSADNVQPVP